MDIRHLKRLYRIKTTHGCVAASYGDDGNLYYSINGEELTQTIYKTTIEGIIGRRNFAGIKIFCDYDNAFTVLAPLSPYTTRFRMFEQWFYGGLYTKGSNSFPLLLLDAPIFHGDTYEKYFESRFFRCAEKKLIGYEILNGINMRMVVSARPPCYHCLPTLDEVVYLHNGKIFRIKQLPKTKTKLFGLDFTEISFKKI